MDKSSIASDRVRELIEYDQYSGVVTWRVFGRRKISKVAGGISGMGYIYIGMDGGLYLMHRIIWLYVYGELPKNQIDHINGIRTDNRLINLRDVVPGVNNENHLKVRSDNKSSGMTGVTWHDHSRKWIARIWVKGVGL